MSASFVLVFMMSSVRVRHMGSVTWSIARAPDVRSRRCPYARVWRTALSRPPHALRDASSDSTDRNAHAAVGHDDRPNDEARPVRREECDDFGDLFWIGSATDRRLFAVFGEEGPPIRHEVIEKVGDDITDANRVHTDAVFDRLERLRAESAARARPWTPCRQRSPEREVRRATMRC